MNIAIITPGAPPARKLLPQAFYQQISGSSQYADSLFSLLIHAGRPPLPWHSLSRSFILLTHVPLYRRSTLGGGYEVAVDTDHAGDGSAAGRNPDIRTNRAIAGRDSRGSGD